MDKEIYNLSIEAKFLSYACTPVLRKELRWSQLKLGHDCQGVTENSDSKLNLMATFLFFHPTYLHK